MKQFDLLRLSFRQVIRHRHRYWGVALAIALGVACFITIVTMGQNIKNNLNQDLELIGCATLIRAVFDNTRTSYPLWFHPETAEAVRRLPGVKSVSLVKNHWGNLRRMEEKFSFAIMATDGNFWEVRDLRPLQGKLFGAAEVEGHQRLCVLGTRLAQKLFAGQNPAGQFLEINHDLYQVAGVVGGLSDLDLAYTLFLPLTTLEDRFPGPMLVDRLYIRCATWDDVERVAAAIPALVKSKQRADYLQIDVAIASLRHIQKISWWVEFFTYTAIIATFVLAGVGISNIMLATVRSRTREIGLKKATGAQDRDILAQFLAESLWVSLGSALLGVGLGRLLVSLIGLWIDKSPSEELFLGCVGLSLLMAVILGGFSGIYPSMQASRMEVISAIRYE